MWQSTAMSTSTKKKIIATAVSLFNEKGTKAVSTNHIAEACGISPGNLYYHFRNKQDIIRAIFEEMDAYGLEQYQQITAQYRTGSLEALEQIFTMIQRYNWRYRFFKRELTALLMDDPLLRERFTTTHQQLLEVVKDSNRQSVVLGILKPLTADEMQLFSEAIWMVALFWLNYLEVGGEDINDKTLARGNEMLRLIMAPYLTSSPSATGRDA